MALFRLIEGDSGKIIIDGLDISKIGLNKLRSGGKIHSEVFRWSAYRIMACHAARKG